ncbi:MAG: hypothetical protein Q7U52_10465 [Hydrogenophaga sp.]|uniref:hypothetical protein n=1 Tax=Hydrogenophaga sp. TaxID=1904254 RepID=UPI00271D6EDE|nr:hypothetical protein [Hydrogenophaga sp.]MDO9148070.1 hypothetical protein [Hydrogenophaga sp.]MDO9603695.1 hypothetical protein [Hydrogenophaga sp.]
MQSLEKRIAALEQAKPATIGPFYIHFVGMDAKDCETERITKGDQAWQRQPGETEQELRERAKREAIPPQEGGIAIFMCW